MLRWSAENKLSTFSRKLISVGLYITYLPLPLVLLTGSDGSQSVHIAPEAFTLASAEFKEDIEFWQNALPGQLKGELSTVWTIFTLICIYLKSDNLAIWCSSLSDRRRRPLQSRQPECFNCWRLSVFWCSTECVRSCASMPVRAYHVMTSGSFRATIEAQANGHM